MNLVSLHDVSLIVAGHVILDHISWRIQTRERVALVGRNGVGKSTFLNLLMGGILPDSGQIQVQKGIKIAGLAQEVPVSGETIVYRRLVQALGDVGDVLSDFYEATYQNNPVKLAHTQQRLDELNAWQYLPKIDAMAERLGFDKMAFMHDLSGGMKRRVLLAAALISSPDLLILDEPTNHLDISSIEWLEAFLSHYPGALLMVTHDRAFLNRVTNSIIELDRGQLHQFDCNYETYLDRKDAMRLHEQRHQALFEKRLADEETWIRQGIKARRTRNEGRVRALKAMREVHRQRRQAPGSIQTRSIDVPRSGQLVLEASHVSLMFGTRCIIRDFSLLLNRKDKIGILGPNGCGKTTLIRLLLGDISPDVGRIRYGTSLSVAYFDQHRRQLDEQKTVMENVAEGADYVRVEGKEKHVASYLNEWLFKPECFNQPVSTLSGGERNRLLLAKLFTKPTNLLVFDEPTNDLDLETLELLESMLVDYQGTLLLISHDRAFIDHVTTSILVFEGDGVFKEYVGGYEDYQTLIKSPTLNEPKKTHVRRASQEKLSYNEQKELTELPEKIESLERTIAVLQRNLASPAFYQNDKEDVKKTHQQLAECEQVLVEYYARWEILESKRG